jgi:hypothetical protein
MNMDNSDIGIQANEPMESWISVAITSDPYMRGYVSGIIDGALNRPFEEDNTSYPKGIDPPLLPHWTQPFKDGYRSGFQAGLLTRY